MREKMNFGEILDRWEKQAPQNRVYTKDKTRDETSTDDVSMDTTSAQNRQRNSAYRRKLLNKKSDASIDLHGLNTEEAWTALQNFFLESRRKGLEKVRIIHGKGNHSDFDSSSAGVLRDLSRRFIESCSFAGESGSGSARDGGSGATWVILKETIAPRERLP